jgi:biotin carboxyl carrier protein
MQLQLLIKEIDSKQTLCSPAVGQIVFLIDDNETVEANDVVAEISILGVRHQLIAPADVRHRINYCENIKLGSKLDYQKAIASLVVASSNDICVTDNTKQSASDNCVLSPQAGRFYHRPSPDADAFVVADETISAGKTIGLLEVMKTFSPVKWNPALGNPQTAVVRKYRVADGDDVEDGQPLLDLDQLS